jgi:hypothetical protein
MKIRKFNEDNNNIDIEYINECLVEMLDKYDVTISELKPYEWQVKNNITVFDVTVKIHVETSKHKYGQYTYDIDNILKASNAFSDLVSISEVAIEKIKSKYNLMAAFDFFKNDDEDEIYYFTIDFKYYYED